MPGVVRPSTCVSLCWLTLSAPAAYTIGIHARFFMSCGLTPTITHGDGFLKEIGARYLPESVLFQEDIKASKRDYLHLVSTLKTPRYFRHIQHGQKRRATVCFNYFSRECPPRGHVRFPRTWPPQSSGYPFGWPGLRCGQDP